jgi:hypothetical protein
VPNRGHESHRTAPGPSEAARDNLSAGACATIDNPKYPNPNGGAHEVELMNSILQKLQIFASRFGFNVWVCSYTNEVRPLLGRRIPICRISRAV